MPKNEPCARVAWGTVRDALAAVHNLETLLRSPRVSASVLEGLFPELHASCLALRGAFEGVPPAGPRRALAAYAADRLDALEQAINAAMTAVIDARARLALEQVAGRVGRELDAAFELLDLIERSEAPTPTEVSLDELALASLSIGTGMIAHRAERFVQLDTRDAGCPVLTDAHVVSRLLAAAIARVGANAAPSVTVAARCEGSHVELRVAAVGTPDAVLPLVAARVADRIAPTDAVVEYAARAIGGSMVALDGQVSLTLPRRE